MPDSLEGLQARLRALPQEVQDAILDHTYAVDPSATNSPNAPPAARIPDSPRGIYIDERYQPPMNLRIPRVRSIFARHYYTNTVFTFHSRALLIKWLVALPPEYRAWLVELRYDAPGWRESERDHEWNATVEAELNDIDVELVTANILLGPWGRKIIYMRAWDFWGDRWVWWNGCPEESRDTGGDGTWHGLKRGLRASDSHGANDPSGHRRQAVLLRALLEYGAH